MGFFKKAKESFQEKQKESAEEKAELKKIYREELAKERGMQESGRRLAAREDARDRARERARAPALSARVAAGAGRVASGAKDYFQKQAMQKPHRGGIDFLGVGGGRAADFMGLGGGNADFFGMQPARARPKVKVRSLSSRARQGQIVINVGAPAGTRTARKKVKRKTISRSQPDFGGFF
jgi:hypothetical protein